MIKATARVTEKGYSGLGRNAYTFVTSVNVNKDELRAYIKSVFKVDVIKINSIRVKGKAVSRGKHSGKRNDYKKYMITLNKGSKIVDFELSEK